MRASLFWLAPLTAVLIGAGLWKEAFAQTAIQQTSIQLTLNRIFVRSLAGGERDRYEVTVEQGQYVHIKIEQRGVDVVLSFYGVDGAELLQIDTPNGVKSFETLDFVATVTGKYRLVVAALDPKAKKGEYRASLTEQRKTRSRDAERIGWQESLIRATKAENQASELIEKGRAAEAEPLLHEALGLRRKVPGSPYVSRPLNLLAVAYEAQGKNDLALQSSEEVMPYLEKDEGKQSSSVGYTLYRIGSIYLAQNKLDRAEPSLRRAVEILAKLAEVPPESLRIARQVLGGVYKAQKKFSEAQEQYQYALKLADREQRGPDNADYAFLMNEVGEVYLEQKNLTAAADAFEKARAICDRIRPAAELSSKVLINLSTIKNVQSMLARHQNNFDQAETLGRECLEILKHLIAINPQEPEASFLQMRALLLNNLGETFLARNDEKRKDLDHADETLREAVAICEKLSPEHEITASALTNWGNLLYKRKRYAQAELALKKAIALYTTLKARPTESLKSKYLLGQLYLDQDSPEQAEPLLLQARDVVKENPGSAAEIANRLGLLYTSTADSSIARSKRSRPLS